ncbi:hypothetical protein Rhal01_03739 [Rubritalea halochordaticola]|uniref:AI-2E family transporter n=1 Tax=Rubritalea halochordaticola TaxID=714537 RepID=A0ABP9V4E0_9BACT
MPKKPPSKQQRYERLTQSYLMLLAIWTLLVTIGLPSIFENPVGCLILVLITLLLYIPLMTRADKKLSAQILLGTCALVCLLAVLFTLPQLVKGIRAMCRHFYQEAVITAMISTAPLTLIFAPFVISLKRSLQYLRTPEEQSISPSGDEAA